VEAPRYPEPEPDASVAWHTVDDAKLLDAMRDGREPAFAEFFMRFAPLLGGLTRRMRISAGERRALVDDFLGDAAMRLARVTHPVPRTLAGYLATSFRRRLALDYRVDARRGNAQHLLLTDVGNGAERAVAETCSEYAIRLASGTDPSDDDSDDSNGQWTRLREELALALRASVTDDEWRILGWRSERVPYREIGEMLGLTAGAARVRVTRLRNRLFTAAKRHIAALPTQDGIVLARVLGGRRDDRAPANGRAPSMSQSRDGRDKDTDGTEQDISRRRGRRGARDE